ASIAAPFCFERFFAVPGGYTVFPTLMDQAGQPMNFARLAVEGTAVLSVAGVTIYALHRLVCLMTWIRSVTFALVATLYFGLVCMLPVVFVILLVEVPELRSVPTFADWAPRLAMVSPVTALMFLFNETGSQFPRHVSTAPLYVAHGVLLGLTLMEIRR